MFEQTIKNIVDILRKDTGCTCEIKNMGNAGRNDGEYYAPRPLIH